MSSMRKMIHVRALSDIKLSETETLLGKGASHTRLGRGRREAHGRGRGHGGPQRRARCVRRAGGQSDFKFQRQAGLDHVGHARSLDLRVGKRK